MVRYFINKTLGKIRFFRPEVMVAVPAGISSTERRAVIEATIVAGSKVAYIIKEPMRRLSELIFLLVRLLVIWLLILVVDFRDGSYFFRWGSVFTSVRVGEIN